MKYSSTKEAGDPSDQKQIFTNINLKLLCCRYWLLNLWDCYNMVFPYWRIYWNKNEGGEVRYLEDTHKMNPDFLYVIPPFTSFSARFINNHRYNKGINVSGKQINIFDNELEIQHESLLHLFIHFKLGIPFDNVSPGILKIKLTKSLKKKLNDITHSLRIEDKDFSLKFNFKIQSFVMETLSYLETELWNTINVDKRVLEILRFIEVNISEKLNNVFLSAEVNMASNSFARLFRNEMNITLHTYVQMRKIARACSLFDYTNKTIKEVAFLLGFSDRYHFSRVFKSITSITPAAYRLGAVIQL